MESKMEILNRVTLIMNYDSAKTLNENKKSLNIIDEQPVPLKPIVRDLEGSLGALRGVERTALKDAFKTEVKNMIRSDGTPIKNVAELESALKNGELGQSVVRLLKNKLLKDLRISPKLKEYLMDDLIQSQRFKLKYRKFNETEVKTELRKYYSPEQAEEIGKRYVKSRGYTDVNPANGQPIKPTAAEVPPAAAAEVPPNKWSERSTTGEIPNYEYKPKVDPQGKPLGQTSDINFGTGNVFHGEVNIGVTQQMQNAGKIMDSPQTVGKLEKTLEGTTEVTTGAIKGETVTVAEAGGKAINKPKRTLLEKGKRAVKVFMLTKAATILVMGGAMIGAAYLFFRKLNPDSDVVLLDSNGQNLPDSSVSSEVEVPPPVDPSTAAPSTAAAPVRPSTQQQQQPEKPAKNLSLTNVLNSVNKPDPNALSQEEKNHLINSIKNGKRYVGADLNPAQRAFVDQYMKNTQNRLYSKDKPKYEVNPRTNQLEPVKQNIKYGKKI